MTTWAEYEAKKAVVEAAQRDLPEEPSWRNDKGVAALVGELGQHIAFQWGVHVIALNHPDVNSFIRWYYATFPGQKGDTE